MKSVLFKKMVGVVTVLTLVAASVLNANAIVRVSTPPEGMTVSAPPQYIFSVDGSDKEFILLDTSDTDDDSKFFVMSKNHYGTHAFTTSATDVNLQKFDVNEENNIAYWLNNDFKTVGNGEYVMPAPILSYINQNHVWNTEAGHNNSDVPEDYTTTCGVAVMSGTEWLTYYPKFGMVDDVPTTSWQGWWLRTAQENRDDKTHILYSFTANHDGYQPGIMNTVSATNNRYVRPVFHLKRDFFLNEKLRIDNLGQSVKDQITDTYTYAEMSAAGLYSTAELASIGYTQAGTKPTAVNVSFSGIPRAGEILTGSYEYLDLGGAAESGTTFAWLSSSSETGTYSQISGASGITYQVENTQSEKYIKFSVTPRNDDGIAGDAAVSDTVVQIQKVLGPVTRLGKTNVAWDQDNKHTNTPQENIFKISGSSKKFILLDSGDDSNSKFFVLSMDSYGTKAFDSDNTQRFDTTDSNNIAYWLNNDFKTLGNGTGNILPEGILNHINTQHIWLTEAGHPNGNCPYDYDVVAGIALMSQTELIQYHPKFGLRDDIPGAGTTSAAGWLLRTARGLQVDTGNYLLVVRTDDHSSDGLGNTHQTTAVYAGYHVRPTFYLNRDFFKNVKLDLSTLGDNVKNAIKAEYSLDEIIGGSAGYTLEEVYSSFGFEVPPAAVNVAISGNAKVGGTLTATYSYNANGGEAEEGSLYQWLISDDYEGPYSPIINAVTTTYTVTANDIGKFIRFQVTPKSEAGIVGSPTLSEPTFLITPFSIESISFTNNAGTGAPSFDAGGSLKVSAQIKNNTVNPSDAVMIVAVYDSQARILKVVASQSKNVADLLVEYDVSVDFTEKINNPMVKVMVWDGLDTMQPLTEMEVY